MNLDFPAALLPIWLLGAPLVLAIVDWFLTPRAPGTPSTPV